MSKCLKVDVYALPESKKGTDIMSPDYRVAEAVTLNKAKALSHTLRFDYPYTQYAKIVAFEIDSEGEYDKVIDLY